MRLDALDVAEMSAKTVALVATPKLKSGVREEDKITEGSFIHVLPERRK